MKTFYSDYVQHCMRFFARHPNPQFKSDADKLNWNACKEAMGDFSDEETEIIEKVYDCNGSIPENISIICTEKNMRPNMIWKLINRLERKIAKRRNLL